MTLDPHSYAIRREVEKLASSLLDKQLDQQDLERLEALLAQDPTARDFFLDCVELHVLLESRHEIKLDATANRDFEQLARQLMGESPCSLCEPPQREEASLSKPNRFRMLPVVLGFGLAVALLLAGGVGLWVRSQPLPSNARSPYVGILSQTVKAKWSADNAPMAVPARLAVGQRLSLESGYAELAFSSGCTCSLQGPAEVELVSPMYVRATRGALWARVGEDAKGFIIETPTAKVVDLGTEFGVDVNGSTSATDVVVFEGTVDLQTETDDAAQPGSSKKNVTRLTSGEALRVEQSGVARRITAVSSDQFPRSARSPGNEYRTLLFGSVTDNIRDPHATKYYQIVRAGLYEDSRVYVDRLHEWNGVDAAGIPSCLRGADYVMCFNSDKWSSTLEITVDLVAPARLFVMYDNRLPVPKWLTSDFSKTEFEIGVDEGYPDDDPSPFRTEFGPGRSIDNVYSVWQRDVLIPGKVKLGALPKIGLEVSMYGIAATPLEDLGASPLEPDVF